METPHDRTIKHIGLQRFAEGYDESMEETIKPTRQGGNRRARTTFDEMRQAAEDQHIMPASRRHSTMSMPGPYEASHVTNGDYLDMNQLNSGMTIQTQFDGLPGPSHPLSASSDFSHQNLPMTPHMVDYSSPFEMKPDLRPTEMGHQMPSGEEGSQSTEKPSRRNSPHRRTESVASIASAASIASIDIEQTKTPTGITLDDINQFIQEPDQRINKWVCTFEGCNKRFGRKENIKSHVQTHLNDRQYKCPNCSKCFVRQHDLKRHAKIHTGVKPYPCQCGNTFARHDALTRHRQRGMCIGAIDGVVRKVVKRGRPRKHRPDMDERKDKSTRTRQKNKSVSSTSSQSSYSDSSAANSPENIDELDMLDDIMDISMGGTTMNPLSLQDMGSSSAPMPTIGADPVLSAHSPSAASVHSYVSQMSHMSLHPDAVVDRMSSHPASPAKSISSPCNNNPPGCNDLPELSQPSSSPPCSRFLDVEPSSSLSETMMSSAAGNANIPSFAGIEDPEDALLFQQFTSDDSMLMLSSDSKLDEDYGNNEPMLMLGPDGELDEGYGSNPAMFTNHEDMFFGST
jgi:regulatory protein SWI5